MKKSKFLKLAEMARKMVKNNSDIFLTTPPHKFQSQMKTIYSNENLSIYLFKLFTSTPSSISIEFVGVFLINTLSTEYAQTGLQVSLNPLFWELNRGNLDEISRMNQAQVDHSLAWLGLYYYWFRFEDFFRFDIGFQKILSSS